MTQVCVTHPCDDRIAAIVRLLETRNDGLPMQRRRPDSPSGFAHRVKVRVSCPDCLANDRVLKGCETCHGRGFVEEWRTHDPYAINTVRPYGFTPDERRESEKARARELAVLKAQTTPPRSEADLLAEANERGEAWEEARKAMYADFDYAALDRAMDSLYLHDADAHRALVEVHEFGWLDPPHGAHLRAALDRGFVFLDGRLPADLRAPAAPESQPVEAVEVGRPDRDARRSRAHDRHARILELHESTSMSAAEIAQACRCSLRTVYTVVQKQAA